MAEFIILPTGETVPQPREDIKWTENYTKLLISLYGKYKAKVGTMKIKTIKQMWKVIAEELQESLNITVTPSSFENRWKVVDRNYKKYIDNNTSTGRGRKFFEYANEMQELLGEKKNVFPTVTLSTATIDIPQQLEKDNNEGEEEIILEPANPDIKKVSNNKKRKKSVLENIRNDRKNYQDARLTIEKEKLAALRERNKILEERNKILSRCKCFASNSVVALE